MSAADRPRIRILHHLARTGGTLISKCLGSMEGVILLSEIHPAGARLEHLNPLNQAHRWFGLLTSDDIARLRQGPVPFLEAIRMIHTRCKERGGILVIRDWTHLDFTGVPFVPNPPHRLRLVEALQQSFEVVNTTTVRHPLDQWLSLRRLAVLQGKLDFARFLYGYRRFAELGCGLGFVRYEDFAADPEGELRTLCSRLALPYDAGFRQRWAGYAKVTGDVLAPRQTSEIRLPPRPPVAQPLLAAFARNADYRRAIELLGYAHPA